MRSSMSRNKAIRPRYRITSGEDVALGPGKVELLDHLHRTGSISEAARQMGMSYNRAWLLIRTMNQCFKKPIVAALRGGAGGGKAELTETGKRALDLYHSLNAESLRAIQKTWRAIRTLLR